MHEVSICRALVRQVEDVAQEAGATAVRRVTVRVGPLAGVVPDLLEAAFPAVTSGTVVAGAVLEIEESPLRVRCTECREESPAALNDLTCPLCGSWRTTPVAGDEMMLDTVTLDVPEHVAEHADV